MPSLLLAHTFPPDVRQLLAGSYKLNIFKNQHFTRTLKPQIDLYLERSGNISTVFSLFVCCRREGTFSIAAHPAKDHYFFKTQSFLICDITRIKKITKLILRSNYFKRYISLASMASLTCVFKPA